MKNKARTKTLRERWPTQSRWKAIVASLLFAVHEKKCLSNSKNTKEKRKVDVLLALKMYINEFYQSHFMGHIYG